jgi:hypothetical protein
MTTSTKHAPALEESDYLAASFYDTACDFPSEQFGQITRRVLGSKGFAVFPNAEAFRNECLRMFNLARSK